MDRQAEVFSHILFYVTLDNFDFKVAWWDARKNGDPVGVISMDQSHLDPVYKTIWVNAKSGAEFFTGSTDGTVSFNTFICIANPR